MRRFDLTLPARRRLKPLHRALAGLLPMLAVAAILWAPPILAQDVDAQVEDILRETAEVRGLALRSPVPAAALESGSLQALLMRDLESDDAVREYRVSGILLETLGLIPAGFDLRRFQMEVLREHVGSLYDREQRRLIVVADGAPPSVLDKAILAHEAAHALQDQHFDLRRLLPAQGASADGRMAATALVEGDAMLTMTQWGRRFLTPDEKLSLDEPRPSSGVLAAAPLIVRAELEFPYLEGQYFAIQLYQEGGFAAIDRALADPPRSTEQIIHPEKYLAREAPRQVDLPPLSGALGGSTWRLLRTDVLGELVLRVLIQETLDWPAAEVAATGWGGDAYAVLEDGAGRRLVVADTAWDSEADAAEFFNAYAEAVAGRFGPALREVQSQPSLIRWSAPGMLIQILHSGDRLRLTIGPDVATLDAVDARFEVDRPVVLVRAPATPPAAGSPTPAPDDGPATAEPTSDDAAVTPSPVPGDAADPTAPQPDAPAPPGLDPDEE
ncbi:MAG: hypothetical protein M3O34_09645 [Chloroflexota bacterium]|nr:hypothetical protein [Chloroflexota bacterium]